MKRVDQNSVCAHSGNTKWRKGITSFSWKENPSNLIYNWEAKSRDEQKVDNHTCSRHETEGNLGAHMIWGLSSKEQLDNKESAIFFTLTVSLIRSALVNNKVICLHRWTFTKKYKNIASSFRINCILFFMQIGWNPFHSKCP